MKSPAPPSTAAMASRFTTPPPDSSTRPALPAAAAALVVGLALAASEALAGTPGLDLPPLPGTPRPLTVPVLQEARLPNGLHVVVAPRADLPLVTIALHLRSGAATDPTDKSGLASLTASLRTKGALRQGKRLDATQIARQAEALGSTLDAQADARGTALSMTVARSQWAAATALIADVTRHPTLAGTELARLKDQASDGLKFSLSDPGALASLVAQRTAWGASPWGGVTTPASLARIDRADVLALQRRQARPDGATLVVAGDVTLDEALRLARQHLGRWVAPKAPVPTESTQGPQPAKARTTLVDLPGAGQTGVVVVAPAVASDDPQRRVAQVAAAVLGSGYSSRLNQEIRIRRGLSYGAGAGLELQPVGGVLHASTQTSHPNAAQVVQLMREEIERLGQTAPADDELAARQAGLVGGFSRQIETTTGLAALGLDLAVSGRPLDEAQRHVPALLAVTPEQVRHFVASHWSAAQLRTVVVGDLGAAGPALTQLDPQARRLNAATLRLDTPDLGHAPPAMPPSEPPLKPR